MATVRLDTVSFVARAWQDERTPTGGGGPVPWELWALIALLVAVWSTVGGFVAVRSYRWNRRTRERNHRLSLALATLAFPGWPIAIRYWELDWTLTGRRTWRGDR